MSVPRLGVRCAAAVDDAVDQAGLSRPARMAGGFEQIRPAGCADSADHACAQDNQGERHLENEDRQEGRHGDPDHQAVLQRSSADADDSVDDDRQHRGLQAEEHARRQLELARPYIGQAEAEHDDRAGEDEQNPGDQSAHRPVQQPAQIDGELLRLRSRKEHAVVEGVQEPLFADPALLVDHEAVHQRDLPRRPAEAEASHLEPEARRFAEADAGFG